MTIKQQGGVFGRNPTFNKVGVDESLNVNGQLTTDGMQSQKAGSASGEFSGYSYVLGVSSTSNGEIILGENTSFQGKISYEGATSGNLYFDNTWNNAGAALVFRNRTAVAAEELGRFNSNGLVLPSGKGIDFSATAGTGTSELFDDYEEGTWTPTTAGDATGALSSALGFYTKIGNFVTVTGYIDVSTNFTSPNVGGLPYTVTQKFGATSVQSAGLVLPGSADTAAIIALPLSTTDTVRFRLGGNSVSHNPNTSRNTYVFSLSYYV